MHTHPSDQPLTLSTFCTTANPQPKTATEHTETRSTQRIGPAFGPILCALCASVCSVLSALIRVRSRAFVSSWTHPPSPPPSLRHHPIPHLHKRRPALLLLI